MKHFLSIFTVIGTTFLLFACASTENSPTHLVTRAQSNISQAQSAGADEYAPVALRDAKQHLDQANTAIKDEKYAEARQLLEKSIADAEYANVKANSKKSQMAAHEIKEQLQTLENEIEN